MIRCSPHTTGRCQLVRLIPGDGDILPRICRPARTSAPGRDRQASDAGRRSPGKSYGMKDMRSYPYVSGVRLLTLTYTHTLLRYQQDACAYHEDAADHVEDRGTDTAGGGKEGTLLVLYCKFIQCFAIYIL